MQIRQWKRWALVLGLAMILAPGVALAQESRPSIAEEFTAVFSMIWNQLGLGELGPDISPDGVTTEVPSGDMSPSISPDGVDSEGTNTDLGVNISPNGLTTEGGSNDLGANISPNG